MQTVVDDGDGDHFEDNGNDDDHQHHHHNHHDDYDVKFCTYGKPFNAGGTMAISSSWSRFFTPGAT